MVQEFPVQKIEKNTGIGGSDPGPYMVTEALKPYWVEGICTARYWVDDNVKFIFQ